MTERALSSHPRTGMSLLAMHPVQSPTEAERNGDPAWTLERVYAEHAPFVWRALRAHGVRDCDLDDLTHEVFLVVHRKLATFEGRSRMTTWLFAIAARVASDYRRSARMRRERVVPDPPAGSTDASSGADEELALAQLRAALDSILDELPPDQRVVFALFEIDGIAADEIASYVEAPLNTVYSRLRLAREHFVKGVARRRARGEL